MGTKQYLFLQEHKHKDIYQKQTKNIVVVYGVGKEVIME